MTDTPQPGTSLPWHVLSEDATGSIVHVDESGLTIVVASMETQEQDATYLVYAANELPKREEALERANAWSQRQAIESEQLLVAAEAIHKAMTYSGIQGWHLFRVTADEIEAFNNAIKAARV